MRTANIKILMVVLQTEILPHLHYRKPLQHLGLRTAFQFKPK